MMHGDSYGQGQTMAARWLQQACRVHVMLVVLAAFCSLTAFAVCYLPIGVVRGYELVQERIDNIAVGSALLPSVIGVVIFVGCLSHNIEPPRLLVHCTLAAILLCVITVLFLPAIAVS